MKERIKSFALRTLLSAAAAGIAYAAGHVVDLGTGADNAALITFALSYVGHFIHASAVKLGED